MISLPHALRVRAAALLFSVTDAQSKEVMAYYDIPAMGTHLMTAKVLVQILHPAERGDVDRSAFRKAERLPWVE